MNGRHTLPVSDRKLAEENSTLAIRAVEFFAGMGGFAMAWPEVCVLAAIDIHQTAAEIYRANFDHTFWVREIQSIATAEIAALSAKLWWLSPPCQPYTLRGARRDVKDPRAQSLLWLISVIAECLPEFIVLENVHGFVQSIARERLVAQLERSGYQYQEIELCPTQLGWPNKRPRYYLIASRGGEIFAWRDLPVYACLAADLVDQSTDSSNSAADLQIAQSLIDAMLAGMDRWDPRSDLPTACFTSSYGRAWLNSGSYLKLRDDHYRRFSPREVANFLGYPATFHLPPAHRTRTLWKLLGNSLSLPAVRYVLSHLPGGPSAKLPWHSPDTYNSA